MLFSYTPLFADLVYSGYDTIKKELNNYFQTRFSTTAYSSLRIKRDNWPLNPEPTNTETWLETNTIFSYAKRKCLPNIEVGGESRARSEIQLIYRVSVRVPLNTGSSTGTKICDEIKNCFPGSFQIHSLTMQLGIVSRFFEFGEKDGWYLFYVDIPLRVDIYE